MSKDPSPRQGDSVSRNRKFDRSPRSNAKLPILEMVESKNLEQDSTKVQVRLGFGLLRGNRIRPMLATAKVIAFLDKLARDKDIAVKGLERFYSDCELANHFGVDESTVRRWAKRRWIGYVDLGDGRRELRRYPASQVEQLIQRRYLPPDNSNTSLLPA